MIALMNFPPKNCPRCGFDFKAWDAGSRQDWYAGASHTCKGCGLHFAHVDGARLLALASATGDMGRYVQQSDVAD